MKTHLRAIPILSGLILLAALLAGCGPAPEPTPTVAPTQTAPVEQPATVAPSPTLTPTPEPSPTATPTATPTPIPQPVQLTTGECCTQPFWSADSTQVRFIDKPRALDLVGIWGVNISEPQTTPALITPRIEEVNAQSGYLVTAQGNTTTIERLTDGESWTVPANGEFVSISPDGTRIAWAVSDEDIPIEQRTAAVWVANLDGSDARRVATLQRGGLSGWISDDALLISGRANSQSQEQVLSALSVSDGSTTELARANRLRGQALSPSRQWLAYYSTFDPDPARNGLWLVRTDGSERIPLDRTLFGAYQWRKGADDTDRLLLVPFDPDAEYHEFWELNADSGEVRQLTDAALTPLKIANGDWRVSPDGRNIAFVESKDRNIWMLALPE